MDQSVDSEFEFGDECCCRCDFTDLRQLFNARGEFAARNGKYRDHPCELVGGSRMAARSPACRAADSAARCSGARSRNHPQSFASNEASFSQAARTAAGVNTESATARE